MDDARRGDDLDDVELDLDDASDSSDYDNEPQTLWRAEASLDEDEDVHTSALVEISDTKPLINVRDPRGVNDCLQVTFEDVIAEPASVRSGDRVWIWSHALFEVSRVWIYRIVTVLLAIPMSLVSGLLFGVLSCLHIWIVGPCTQCLYMATRWLQALWSVALGVVVRPLFTSAGKCCGGFSVHLAEE